MTEKKADTMMEVQVGSADTGADKKLVISGEVPDLHRDPEKIHRLLDLLDLPKGTQVKVVTTATSVIVR